MIQKANRKGEWYLNSYTSRHICNNHKRFLNLQTKTYEFVTISRNIIRSTQFKIIIFPFRNGLELTLSNVAYTLKYDSNLIFLSQLPETRIFYHNHPKYMLLKQKKKTIGLAIATRKKNLFILNTQIRGKIMLVRGKGRETYPLSRNP